MFSSPGALCMYSTGKRGGLIAKDNNPSLGPTTYDPKYPSIVTRKETLPPFDRTERRETYRTLGNPSPADYNPWQRPRYEIGCPLMRGIERFSRVKDVTGSPGPVHKVPDPWLKMLIDLWLSSCMKPRVQFEKFVSNNAPSVFHPLELRSFVTGVDGRMYPWRMNRKFKVPGPRYNTYKILTSQSFTPRIVDFSRMSKRPPLFPIIPGFGAADFMLSEGFRKNGGVFLSKSTQNVGNSTPRLFEMIINHTMKTIYPSPFHHSVIREFERMSSKAVSAPFKSTAPRLRAISKFQSPAPCDHFDSRMTLDDLRPKLTHKSSPPQPASFLTTAERFPENYYHFFSPSPNSYTLKGMADDLCGSCRKYAPAIPNPKMGFLVSSLQCASFIAKPEVEDPLKMLCGPHKERKWQNIRPKIVATYTFRKGIVQHYSSPGPIHDTRAASAFIKGKSHFWDPRSPKCQTGFLNSGYDRKIVNDIIDHRNPGPAVYNTRLPLGGGGRVVRTERRFVEDFKQTPSPHKLHEKGGSSVWRASHLGTFNSHLKGIYSQRPSAGGFHPHGPIDDLCDKLFEVNREDGNAGCPITTIDTCETRHQTEVRKRSRKYSGSREGTLFGMGNPLLDISAVVDPSFLEQYELDPNGAILADEEHTYLYTRLVEFNSVKFTAGGSGQNTLRVAQWILRYPRFTTFCGAVGNDDFANVLKKHAEEDGVRVRYQITKYPTGKCAVLITGHERSLVTYLGAAKYFDVNFFSQEGNWTYVERAQFYYISGFFLAVSPESMVKVGMWASENDRPFVVSLSAAYIPLQYRESLNAVMPFVDILFGNDAEARAFSTSKGWETKDIVEIAKKVCNLPKENQQRNRIVVFTQGTGNVIVTTNESITEYPVEKLEKDKIVDTNGAGDAFVGGFLAQLVQNRDIDECIKCAMWAASQIIQQSGCSFPRDIRYE